MQQNATKVMSAARAFRISVGGTFFFGFYELYGFRFYSLSKEKIFPTFKNSRKLSSVVCLSIFCSIIFLPSFLSLNRVLIDEIEFNSKNNNKFF